MKHNLVTERRPREININKPAYFIFLMLVLIQIIMGNYDDALSNLGIALIFDPFSPLKWEERTKAQKACLLIHLTILIGGAAFLFLS